MASAAEGAMLAAGLAEALSLVLSGLQQAVPPSSAGPGVTRSQLTALRALAENGPQSMLDLAALVGVTAPSMTSTVKLLVDRGLAGREHHGNDWRTVWITPTEAGLQAHRRYTEERSSALARAVADLPPEQRAMLLVALPALRALAGRISAPSVPR